MIFHIIQLFTSFVSLANWCRELNFHSTRKYWECFFTLSILMFQDRYFIKFFLLSILSARPWLIYGPENAFATYWTLLSRYSISNDIKINFKQNTSHPKEITFNYKNIIINVLTKYWFEFCYIQSSIFPCFLSTPFLIFSFFYPHPLV